MFSGALMSVLVSVLAREECGGRGKKVDGTGDKVGENIGGQFLRVGPDPASDSANVK